MCEDVLVESHVTRPCARTFWWRATSPVHVLGLSSCLCRSQDMQTQPSFLTPDGGPAAAGHHPQPSALDAAARPFAPRPARGSYSGLSLGLDVRVSFRQHETRLACRELDGQHSPRHLLATHRAGSSHTAHLLINTPHRATPTQPNDAKSQVARSHPSPSRLSLITFMGDRAVFPESFSVSV